jgi:hypothetical protein
MDYFWTLDLDTLLYRWNRGNWIAIRTLHLDNVSWFFRVTLPILYISLALQIEKGLLHIKNLALIRRVKYREKSHLSRAC